MALTKCPECDKEISHKYRKIIIRIFIAILVIVNVVTLAKLLHKEVLHGTNWGMEPSEVERQETKYSGTNGTYNSNDNYYAVSDVDFYNAKVTLMYIFEDDKLSSIWIQPNDTSYENVYNIAASICEKEGLPINFEHKKLGKHMMHLVRLYYMVFDILEKGEINTYREKEHDLLMSIRNGDFLIDGVKPKDEFYSLVDDLDARLQKLKMFTKLPEEPDYKAIDRLYLELIN